MIRKYIVRLDESCVFGLKYNPVTEAIIIGGKTRWKIEMSRMARSVFGCKGIRWERTCAVNKIRTKFKITGDGFTAALGVLAGHGVSVQEVESLGRIMI